MRRHPGLLATLWVLVLLATAACSGGGSDGSTSADGSSPSAPSSSEAGESPAAPTESAEVMRPAMRVRPTFFGMHDGRVTRGLAPSTPVGALRFWDSSTSWWHVETSPGQFTWGALDTAVATAESAGARPLLVMGQSPTFHASRPEQEAAYGPGAASMPKLGAWRSYVTALAERYGNRIDYQIWNEANIDGYWAGTPKQMARLTIEGSRAIRRIVPDATVVAPAFALRLPSQQRYFERYWRLQSRGFDVAGAVDAVAVHLYPLAEDPPEAQLELFEGATQILEEHGVDLPVWNTEINFGLMGGPEPPPIPAERQRAFMMRALILNAGLGVQRVYWYRWDLRPIANTLLTTPDYSALTMAGRAFPVVREWLEGTAVQEGCDVSGGVWECTARAGGEARSFLWKPRGPVKRMTMGESARSWTDAEGRLTRCKKTCELQVGETPVMVTSR